MRGPDFLVVGAPKCGTTALHTYLSRNENLFLAPKEPEFFGSDLVYTRHRTRMARSTYEALFPPSDVRLRGDISVWYLFSTVAAQEIYESNPTAKIVVMVRNPVDQMWSLHSQLLYSVDEDEPSFQRALDLEQERKRGRSLPRSTGIPFATRYREIATFSTQIQRYMKVFPRSQIHFIVLEDLKTAPSTVWQRLHNFLGADPGTRPQMEPVNTNKVNRSQTFAATAMYAKRVLMPRLGLSRLPQPVRHSLNAVYGSTIKWNRTARPRAKMDIDLRRELLAQFDTEIGEMETILGRKLDRWRR